MRKVTQEVVGAFNAGRECRRGNTRSTGDCLYLHGNLIAERRPDGVYITNAGWSSNVTKERLNGIYGVNVYQKAWHWYLNGNAWDGKMIRVSDGKPGVDCDQSPLAQAMKTTRMAAMLGSLLTNDQAEANTFKKRMLTAGLGDAGLSFPDDFDQLPEEEKQRRLDGALEIIK